MRGTTTEQTPGNPPDTAQNDHESQQSHCHPGGPGRNGEAVGQRPGDGIGLGHVPHAQGGQNCEEGEEKGQGTSQPLPPQGGAHGIHGAAAHFAAGVPLAVLDGQQALRALGGKAEEGGDLHPHQGHRGPPATKAVATPTMFPVPMVAASVVIRAEKGDTSPAPPALARESRPRTLFSAQPRFRQGRKRVRRVRKTPVPISSTSIPGPQTAGPHTRSTLKLSWKQLLPNWGILPA